MTTEETGAATNADQESKEIEAKLDRYFRELLNEKQDEGPRLGVVVAIVLAVVVGVALAYVKIAHGGFDGNWAEVGQLGDSLAPIAAMLSAIAVAVALWSVNLQRRELRDNRKVSFLQWHEMRASARAQADLVAAQQRAADVQALAAVSEQLATIESIHSRYVAMFAAGIQAVQMKNELRSLGHGKHPLRDEMEETAAGLNKAVEEAPAQQQRALLRMREIQGALARATSPSVTDAISKIGLALAKEAE